MKCMPLVSLLSTQLLYSGHLWQGTQANAYTKSEANTSQNIKKFIFEGPSNFCFSGTIFPLIVKTKTTKIKFTPLRLTNVPKWFLKHICFVLDTAWKFVQVLEVNPKFFAKFAKLSLHACTKGIFSYHKLENGKLHIRRYNLKFLHRIPSQDTASGFNFIE